MYNQIEKFMIKTLINKVSFLERKLLDLENSKSWKITYPLRFLKNFLTNNRLYANDISSNQIDNFLSLIPKTSLPLYVLFSHEVSNTGAPNVLLQLGKSINQLKLGNVVFVSHKNAEMHEKFNEIAPTLILGDASGNLTIDLDQLVKKLSLNFPEARYLLNTVTLNFVADVLSANSLKFFSWVHELPVSWNIIGIDNVLNQIRLSRYNFVDSLLIKDCIIKEDSTLSNKVGFIDNAITLDSRLIEPNVIFDELNIPRNFKIITILGTRQPRKGFDLFPIFINELIKKNYNNLQFCIIWMGKPIYIELDMFISAELNKLETTRNYRLVNPNDEYQSFINASDLVISLSREDSNPQVLAYAEYYSKPVIKLMDFYNKNKLSWVDNLEKLVDELIDNNWSKNLQTQNSGKSVRTWDEITLEIINKINNFYE